MKVRLQMQKLDLAALECTGFKILKERRKKRKKKRKEEENCSLQLMQAHSVSFLVQL